MDCLNSGPVILRSTTTNRSYDNTQYVRTYRYGYIDVHHFEGGVAQTKSVIAQIKAGQNRITVRQEVRAGIGFEAIYRVHNRPKAEAVEGIALGIFMDYSWQFEKWQNRGLGSILMEGVQGSSFSVEDLPTDYLGFYGAARDKSLATIVRKLGGGEPTQSGPPKVRVWGLVGERESKNFDFTPRVKQGAAFQNVPWPQDMTITPITDSSHWQREGERTIWPWTDFIDRLLP